MTIFEECIKMMSAVELHHLVSEAGENLADEEVDVAHQSATGFE